MKLKLQILTAVAALTLAIDSYAQTPPPTIGSFFSDIPAYLTTHDTNTLVAQGSRIEVFNDMLSGSTLGLSGLMGARVNFATPQTVPQPTANTLFAVGGIRYAGVGGIITGGDIGVGYSWVRWDTRLSLKLSGGYDKQLSFNKGGEYISPGLWLEKAASKVIPGVGIEFPVLIEKGGKVSISSTPEFVIKMTIPF